MGIPAAARSVLLLAPQYPDDDPKETKETEYALAHIKSNHSELTASQRW